MDRVRRIFDEVAAGRGSCMLDRRRVVTIELRTYVIVYDRVSNSQYEGENE